MARPDPVWGACPDCGTEPTEYIRADLHAALIERAFRDGIAYASNCKVTDVDEAWRTSRVRADMLGRGK